MIGRLEISPNALEALSPAEILASIRVHLSHAWGGLRQTIPRPHFGQRQLTLLPGKRNTELRIRHDLVNDNQGVRLDGPRQISNECVGRLIKCERPIILGYLAGHALRHRRPAGHALRQK